MLLKYYFYNEYVHHYYQYQSELLEDKILYFLINTLYWILILKLIYFIYLSCIFKNIRSK